MARRLGTAPQQAALPVSPVKTTEVAVRTKGLQLLQGLASLDQIVSIDTAEGYLEMDAHLARIRNTRAQWKLAMEPITGPLDRTIQKQKEALAEAKKAAEGAHQLEAEIGNRLDAHEKRAKELMADYKRKEQQLIKEREEENARTAQKLLQEANQRAIAAASARTPQLKARLEQQRAELERHAEEIQEEPVATPVKGASSTSRVTKKVRIADPIAFLRSVIDYEPTSGVYQMKVPPLTVTDRKGEPSPLVEIVNARLMELYREQPGVVLSWPGVEEYDDFNIAGR